LIGDRLYYLGLIPGMIWLFMSLTVLNAVIDSWLTWLGWTSPVVIFAVVGLYGGQLKASACKEGAITDEDDRHDGTQ